jgi:arylsulfatase A-like enzyme
MIRNAQWKLAVNTVGKAYLLFDLENDPQETRNLAGLRNYQDVEVALRLRMLQRLVRAQLRQA